jgi:phospholipid transport system substrate-binding protein
VATAERGCSRAGCAVLLLVLSATASAQSAGRDHPDDSAPLPPDRVVSATAARLAAEVAARRVELREPQNIEALVERVLLPHFDFESSCRLILHEHWRSATAEQRQRFIAAFYRYLLASHGDALAKFRDDTIQVLPLQEAAAGASTRVRTRMRLSGGEVFGVDFYLRLDDSGWRIVDVIAEGISYVKTYRTDFSMEIRADGLEALTDRLEELAAVRKQ